MGAHKQRGLVDVLFWTVLSAAAFVGACSGLTEKSKDHVEVQNEECVTCHRDEYEATTNPVHANLFSDKCAECHTQSEWSPAKFYDHSAFPLVGAHKTAGCKSCHGDPPQYEGQPKDCYGCHQDDYDATAKPPHAQASFGQACLDCHTQSSWIPAKFQHPFPLIGPHANPVNGCSNAKCHGDPPKYEGIPTECYGCHQDDYQLAPTKKPGHEAYPTTCDDCHNALAWKPASDKPHPFPLAGAHATTPCASCHKGNPPVYKGTPQLCIGCHQANYDKAPGHQTLPTACQQCHSTFAWKPASGFKHLWPLNGAHVKPACTACHKGDPPVYKGTPTDCFGCHAADFNQSPYPGHAGFSHTCTSCHTTNAWKPATGTGHPESKFPIKTGAHKVFACNECHNSALGANGKGNADCVGCHTGQHTRAKMDAKHKGENGYPTGAAPGNFCLKCHPNGKN